ncbi:hypothetical protein GUJ93_ZPchr0001g33061 [Zizania palustris]|uniref:Uncharacterized protein n=1 Tax=Zizania palustris TaxID=103762 RepID=A0A8J5RMG0_ZIZPA|nr:hypothetical protein GUJ93_ZPchr0001g33061 [Zizania palustris]
MDERRRGIDERRRGNVERRRGIVQRRRGIDEWWRRTSRREGGGDGGRFGERAAADVSAMKPRAGRSRVDSREKLRFT